MSVNAELKYETTRFDMAMPVCDYVRDYVDIPHFLSYCKECPSYMTVWTCPEYDFDVLELWNRYMILDIALVKIEVSDSDTKDLASADYSRQIGEILADEKDKLFDELIAKEKIYPGSLSLSAGSCSICGKGECTRPIGEPCRHPELLRYSIESIGGDVVKTSEQLFDIKIEWIEGDSRPSHFVLVCGLLRK